MPKTLRAYQEQDIQWLNKVKRGALWWDVGLGKSVVAVYVGHAHLPALVVCPGYLTSQWRDEILDEFPGDTILMVTGTMIERQSLLANATLPDWTITATETIRNHAQFPTGYQIMILDEMHHYRGRTSQQSKGAFALSQRIPYIAGLTASPIKVELDDIYQQMRLLDPKVFHSFEWFTAKYCKVVATGFTSKVVGVRHELELRALLNKYRSRRTYKSTGLRRPIAIERTIEVTPSPRWKGIYDSVRKNYRLLDVTFESAPAMLAQLRSMTFEQKIATAKAIAEDNPNTLFFVYYRDSAAKLASALDVPCITGALSQAKRRDAAKAATSAVVTISSLSEGVDLTHFTAVAYLEDSYVPADKIQATGRVVRWNADNTGRSVPVFNVRVKGTIDARIASVTARRTADMVAVLREELGIDATIGGLIESVKIAFQKA